MHFDWYAICNEADIVKRIAMAIVVGAAISVLSSQAAAQRVIPGLVGENLIREERARRIVTTMVDVYSRCWTYQDTGTVRWKKTKMTFITQFKKPGRLYFELTEFENGKSSRMVYWTEGVRKKINPGHGYTFLTSLWDGRSNSYQKNESLETTVAGLTGVSMGAGANVPTMLLPSQIQTLCLTDVADLKWEQTARERGVICDVLYSKKHATRAWIDRRTHLLRKLVEDDTTPKGSTVILYSPAVNGPITDKLMTFKVPTGAKRLRG
jgi:hypothetical protein